MTPPHPQIILGRTCINANFGKLSTRKQKKQQKKEEKREKNVEKLQGLAVVMNYNFIQKSKRFSKSRKTQMKEAKKNIIYWHVIFLFYIIARFIVYIYVSFIIHEW